VAAYSLGNFVFDQDFSRETSTSAVLRILLDAHGVRRVEFAAVGMRGGRVLPLAPGGAESHRVEAALAHATGTLPSVPAASRR
jgi:poly-gamma-glutamate capsule biosynthesis protein CapA/YwtB (metallophosphatase superfamily)